MKIKLLLSCSMGLASLALVSCSDVGYYGSGVYDSYGYGSPIVGSTTYIYSSAHRTSHYPYFYQGRYFRDRSSALSGYRHPARHYDYKTRKPYRSHNHTAHNRGRNNHLHGVNHRDNSRPQRPVLNRQNPRGLTNPRSVSTRDPNFRNRGNTRVTPPRTTPPRVNPPRTRGAQRPNLPRTQQNVSPRPATRPQARPQRRQAPTPQSRERSSGNRSNFVNTGGGARPAARAAGNNRNSGHSGRNSGRRGR